MIDDNGPIIEADCHIGHVDIALRQVRQAFEPAAEVVAKIADGAAGER